MKDWTLCLGLRGSKATELTLGLPMNSIFAISYTYNNWWDHPESVDTALETHF